jgi:hypothetical protein
MCEQREASRAWYVYPQFRYRAEKRIKVLLMSFLYLMKMGAIDQTSADQAPY